MAPGTGFDLLGGEYSRIRRVRIVLIAAIGIGVLLFSAAGIQAITAVFSNTLNQSSINQVRSETNKAIEETNKLLPGGISDSSIDNHTKVRAAVAVYAQQSSFDASSVVTEIVSAAPSGVVVTQVQVTADSSTEKSSTGRIVGFRVSITATADPQVMSSWLTALSTLAILSNVSSSNSDTTVTTTASLNGMLPQSLPTFISSWAEVLPKDGVVRTPVKPKVGEK